MSVATLSYLFICFPVANWINAVENHCFLVYKCTHCEWFALTHTITLSNVSILFGGLYTKKVVDGLSVYVIRLREIQTFTVIQD